ncbi:hypothetical protein [Phytoactinopolyspora alkaliphila]|nr:hypothetical protein [Phytoactinopolyspora alkaliphila]
MAISISADTWGLDAERGGHFLSMEKPEILVGDIRDSFCKVR